MAANNIEANGAKAISQSLRVNASLLTLDLSSNPLGPIGKRLFSAFSFMLLLNLLLLFTLTTFIFSMYILPISYSMENE